MKITFLGTGTSQGVPVVGCTCPVCASLDPRDKRFRSSIAIEVKGKSLVVDTGPDFRSQALANHLTQLDAVLFTHSHKDHVAGMDDTRPFYFRRGKRNIPIYGNQDTIQRLKEEFYYAFEANKYPSAPGFDAITIGKDAFEVEGVRIMPIAVVHGRMPVLGFRIGDFVYITDANYIPPEELEKVKGCRVFVLNALERTKHVSHYSLEQAIALSEEVDAEQTFFTHCSHYLGMHEAVSQELPKGMALAYDGLTVTL